MTSRALTALACHERKFIYSVAIALFLSLLGVSADARDYYISNHADGAPTPTTIGNDSTGDGSIESPWRSLSKLQLVELQANDNVYLACGGLWREPLRLAATNVKGAPIRISSYGDDCVSSPPIINGAARLSPTGWTASPSYPGVYEYILATPPKQLIANSIPMMVARYPEKGYLDISSDSPNGYLKISNFNSINLTALAGSGGIIGADIHIRSDNWLIENRKVNGYTTGLTSGDIQFSDYLSYPAKKDFGFYLSNQAWMLGNPGQWFFDAASGKLYFKPPAGISDISALTIEVSVIDNVVEVNRLSDVEISGLKVVNGAKYGIQMLETPNAKVIGNTVVASGETGIGIMNATELPRARDNAQVTNNTVRYSTRWGIRGVLAYGLQINGNLIEDTGFPGPDNYAIRPWSPHGINIAGPNSSVLNNTIRRSAYGGINFDNLNATIQHNLVEDVCLILSDCGAIYAYNVTTPALQQGSQVLDNLVTRVAIGREGTPASKNNRRAIAAGLYFDNGTANIEATGNSIFDAEIGVVVHDATNISVSSNRFLKSIEACFLLSDANVGNSYFQNACLVGGQAFGFSRVPEVNEPVRAGSAVSIDTGLNYLTSLAGNIFSSNTYAGLYGPAHFKIERSSDTANNGNTLGRAQWSQLFNNSDALNSPVNFGLQLFKPAGQVSPNLILNGDFGSAWSFWSASSASPATASLETGGSCTTPPCQRFTAQSSGDIMMSNNYALQSGKFSILSYHLKSPDVNARTNLTIRHAAANYESSGFSRYEWLASEWRTFSVPFEATIASASYASRLDIYGILGKAILVDNVSLVQADAIDFNPTAIDVLDLVNASSSSQSFECPILRVVSCSNYVDTEGNPVSWPVLVPAWKITALIWKGSPFHTPP